MAFKVFSKITTAFFVSILLGLIYQMLEMKSGISFSGGVFFVIIIAFIGTSIYGIPVSFLSDFITHRIKFNRFIIAAFIHVLFGFILLFYDLDIGGYALICSWLFFLLDELQNSLRKNRGFKKPGKKFAFDMAGACGIFVLALFGFSLIVHLTEQTSRETFLIPEGYKGGFRIIYNIKDAPAPKKDGEYHVYQINERGYVLSPLPVSEGTIENRYYYVDNSGHKERIKDVCISGGGTGEDSVYGYDITITSSNYRIMPEPCDDDSYSEIDLGATLDEIVWREGLDKRVKK
ncbi:DUF6843 domain-containing protein [Peribacillus deserti]|uniref:DUF6843 domain-containing protein n=1 Tax=Peribacillus deserti TaxID=673318 RepID=A0A2N5MBW7_9BACI|nr:hypothetical protein [Peribacillus deserti]PLT31837.1 hypothetical protein CUU66_01375 [Peribacillus deserti]